MTGPVWRFEKNGTFYCDECLREVTAAYLEGRVVSSTLEVDRTLCESCYDASYAYVMKDTDSPSQGT